MKSIDTFIIEKLVLNKNINASLNRLDTSNKKLMMAIIESTYISLYKNYTFKQKGLSQYTIKRTEIKWEDIVDILEKEYNFYIDKDDAQLKNGELQKIVRKMLPAIESLVNMKKIHFNLFGIGEILNGHDIYWNVWKKYAEKYKIRN